MCNNWSYMILRRTRFCPLRSAQGSAQGSVEKCSWYFDLWNSLVSACYTVTILSLFTIGVGEALGVSGVWDYGYYSWAIFFSVQILKQDISDFSNMV